MAKVGLRVVDGGGGKASEEPPPLQDSVVEECLEDALGPYLGLLSPEEVAEHRDFLTIFVTTHPAARTIYERLAEGRRKRPPTARSGEVAKDGAAVDGDADLAANGTDRGRP